MGTMTEYTKEVDYGTVSQMIESLHKSVTLVEEDVETLFGRISSIQQAAVPSEACAPSVRQAQSTVAIQIEDAVSRLQNLSDVIRHHTNRIHL